jgi:hypothetical protein
MTEIVRVPVASAFGTRQAGMRSYESKEALMRELSMTVLIGRPETTHNSSYPPAAILRAEHEPLTGTLTARGGR